MPKSRGRRTSARTLTQKPPSPYGMVIDALGEITTLGRAMDAELMISSLLGEFYANAPDDRPRAFAVEQVAAGVLRFAERRRTPAGDTVHAVLRSAFPELEAPKLEPGPATPRWVGAVGAVRPVATYAYSDEYGDQTSFVATYRYEDPELGGPEHAVVTLVDHNLGFLKDVFVAESATELRERIEELVASDETVQLRDIDPAELRRTVADQLAATDEMTELPDSETLTETRVFGLGRLALLPDGEREVDHEQISEEARDALIADFMAEAASALEAAGVEPDTARACAELVVEYHDCDECRHPLRWSPVAAEFFLLDWVPRRKLLPPESRDGLPAVLRAWATWAGQRRGLRPAAVAETLAAIDEMTPEFREKTDPETGTLATLLTRLRAEGVDVVELTDPDRLAQALRQVDATRLARIASGLDPDAD